MTDDCGGCQGQGSHRVVCPHHPDYTPWLPPARKAEDIGDWCGDPKVASALYALGGELRAEHQRALGVKVRARAAARRLRETT